MESTSPNILARLRELFPDARITTLRKMVADGRVELNGVRVRSVNLPAPMGEQVTVREASDRNRVPSKNIIFSDAHILIFDKPIGLITSTTRDERRPTAIAQLEKQIDRAQPGGRIYLVHRLDRDASGLLIFARDVRSLANLKMQFRRHTITRRYQAWVHGQPPKSGELIDTLAEDALGRVGRSPAGKPARLQYRLIRTDGPYSLLEVELYTGRKHQIRVQLALRGWPVLGDRLYGKAEGQKRLLLHAVELMIHHPADGRRTAFRSPPPHDFQPVRLPPAGRDKSG